MARAILVALVLAAPLSAGAGSIRKWVDEDGVVHYSNVRESDRPPARYVRMPGGGVRIVLEGQRENAPRKTGTPTRRRETDEYDAILREAAARYAIPVALARAVLAAESNFDPNAVSRAGALGLMQLMPQTAAEMYVADAFDPRENIFGGVRYLRVLTNLFDGDLVKVIAAYNAGPEAVRKAGGIPNIPETQAYVARVLRLYREYLERESREGSNES